MLTPTPTLLSSPFANIPTAASTEAEPIHQKPQKVNYGNGSLCQGRWKLSNTRYFYRTSSTQSSIYFIQTSFRSANQSSEAERAKGLERRGEDKRRGISSRESTHLRKGRVMIEDGQTHCQETIHRNPFYLFMQQPSIRESPSLIMKCVFAEARAAVQLLLESLCLSTPLSSLLPLFFRSDHSREAMSCFIHCDASPTVLNPSLAPLFFSQRVKAWLISTSLCSKH